MSIQGSARAVWKAKSEAISPPKREEADRTRENSAAGAPEGTNQNYNPKYLFQNRADVISRIEARYCSSTASCVSRYTARKSRYRASSSRQRLRSIVRIAPCFPSGLSATSVLRMAVLYHGVKFSLTLGDSMPGLFDSMKSGNQCLSCGMATSSLRSVCPE